MTDTDSDTTEYRLQDGVGRVVRSGLVLEGDDTVTLAPDEAAAHDDVLEPVDEQTTAATDETSSEEAADE